MFEAKPQKAELDSIMATHSMQLLHINYLTGESGKTDKDINILVVTDHLTRYTQAFITPCQTAKVVAQTLWDCFFVHCRLPRNSELPGV